jgi:hypothetical protein
MALAMLGQGAEALPLVSLEPVARLPAQRLLLAMGPEKIEDEHGGGLLAAAGAGLDVPADGRGRQARKRAFLRDFHDLEDWFRL